MNTDQWTGIVRAVAPAIVAYLVGKGWLTETAAADVSAALIAVAMAVWSVFSNKTGKVIK